MSGLGGAAHPNGKNDNALEQKALLNTYIHNYLVHEGHFDLAKAIRNSSMTLNQPRLKKEDGNGRQQMNGADDSMDADSKDDLNNRLGGPTKLGDTFLLDYWFIFWDMWTASKRTSSEKQGENGNEPAGLYWDHQKAKKSQMNPPMMQPNMMANGFPPFGRPNMMPNQQFNSLQKTAMANNGRTMNPQFQNTLRMQQQLAAQQQMGMDGSEVDFNGNPRPPSPMSAGENAPSPKRPRVDGGPFNTGPAMAGRNPMASQLPNGAPGNPDAMRIQNPKNFSPDQLTQMMSNSTQRNYSMGLQQSTKAAMNGNGMPNGVPGGMPQMSPDMPDGSPNGNPEMMMYQNGAGKGVGGGNGGALADYQMQLMLLEQQNKKRLMVARQENAHDPQRFVGNPALGAQAMSPHGSKTGHSPPGSDRQRGTPRMGQGGSPLPDGPQNRVSPAPGAFGDMTMNMGQPFMHPNGGPMMRPPGANPPGTPNANHPMNAQQFEMFRNSQAGPRIPSGNWANPGMPGQMPGQGQPQPGNPDNNQQRVNMPPPQAPPAAGKPSPTQASAAAPTTNQGNAKNSKKKETKEPKKKQTKKNNQSTTAATPSNEAEKAPTPTPQTPITPVNPESHIIKGQQPPNSQPQQQQSNNSTAPSNIPPSQDNGVNNPAPFGNLGNMDNEIFNVDYMDGHHDVLDAFDFDTFLESGAMDSAMDATAFPDFPLPADGMETGTGDA